MYGHLFSCRGEPNNDEADWSAASIPIRRKSFELAVLYPLENPFHRQVLPILQEHLTAPCFSQSSATEKISELEF